MSEPHSYSELLPGALAVIADAAGLDAALKVAEAKGGTRTYIPATLKDSHWLVELVGMERAQVICACLVDGPKGEEIEIPLGPAGRQQKYRRRLRELIDEGRSKPEIARLLGIDVSTVRRYKNGQLGGGRTASNQPDLFES